MQKSLPTIIVGRDDFWNLYLRGLYHQLCKICLPQSCDQFFLGIAPYGTNWAVIFKRTNAFPLHTFIQLNGTINGFDDFKQGDLPGVASQRYPSTRAAGCVEQTCD